MNLELLTVNEHSSPTYPPRTEYNAKSSDLTLAIARDLTTAGEKLTKRLAGENYIGFQLTDDLDHIHVARELFKALKVRNAQSLNIAGNGIYSLNGTSQDFVNNYVYRIIAQVHHFYPISKIYTGGQTGFDLAGAVAGYALEIPTEVTLPKGFRQRFEHHAGDVIQTREDIVKQITSGALNLQPYEIQRTKPQSSSKPKP